MPIDAERIWRNARLATLCEGGRAYGAGESEWIDLLNAYQNLLEGSKNHLRAYVKNLAAQGFAYAPQYISQELYDAIMGL